MQSLRMRRGRAGFTLIELLVVIAIIAILAAILFPIFTRARDRANLARCMSNLKQCGAAVFMYTDDYSGFFPVGYILNDDGSILPGHGWPEGQCVGGNYGILPKSDPSYPLKKYSLPKYRPLNKYVRTIEVFHCPSELRQDCAGTANTFPWIRFGSSYNFNLTFHYPDENTLIYTLVGKKIGNVRSTKRLILMGERAIHYWDGVRESMTNPKPRFEKPFLGHMNDQPWTPVLFCDGHVDYICMTPGLSGTKWDLILR